MPATASLLSQLGSPQIAVCGDPMLDTYVWGSAERVSPEAPVLALRVDRSESRPGGAANVATMLAKLQANVSLIGAMGDDEYGRTLIRLLRENDVAHCLLCPEQGRSTTVKERYLGRIGERNPHPLLRVDRETVHAISRDTTAQLLSQVTARDQAWSAIVLSDYNKGTCTPEFVKEVIRDARRRNIPSLADPPANVDWSAYRGLSVLVPNRRKAEQFAREPIHNAADAERVGRRLCDELDLEAVVITLDRDGLMAVPRSLPAHHFPGQARHVVDVTGAGDAVLSVLALSLGLGLDVAAAAEWANIGGGLEVEKWGVVPFNRQELESAGRADQPWKTKVLSRQELASRVSEHRRRGERIVLTNGCFDMLHVGHVSYLYEAAAIGDVLIVAVNSDDSVRRLKGPTRPVIRGNDRAAMLSALACVQYVVVFDEDTPHALLELLRPDVLVKGGTYSADQVVGREIVLEYGGEVRVLCEKPNISTTAILNQIQEFGISAKSTLVAS